MDRDLVIKALVDWDRYHATDLKYAEIVSLAELILKLEKEKRT